MPLTVDINYAKLLRGSRASGAPAPRSVFQQPARGQTPVCTDIVATSIVGRKYLRNASGNELTRTEFMRWLSDDFSAKHTDEFNRGPSCVEFFSPTAFTCFFDIDIKHAVTEDFITALAELALQMIAECTLSSCDISLLQVVVCTTVDREGNFVPYKQSYLQCPFCEGVVKEEADGHTLVCPRCGSTWNRTPGSTGSTVLQAAGQSVDVKKLSRANTNAPRVSYTLKSGFHLRIHGARVDAEVATRLCLLIRHAGNSLFQQYGMDAAEAERVLDLAPYRGLSLRYVYATKAAVCTACGGRRNTGSDASAGGNTSTSEQHHTTCVVCGGSGHTACEQKAYSIMDVLYAANGKWLSSMVIEERTGVSPRRPIELCRYDDDGEDGGAEHHEAGEDDDAEHHEAEEDDGEDQHEEGSGGKKTRSGCRQRQDDGELHVEADQRPAFQRQQLRAGDRQMDVDGRHADGGDESVRAAAHGAAAEQVLRCNPVTREDYLSNLLLVSLGELPSYAVGLQLFIPRDLPEDVLAGKTAIHDRGRHNGQQHMEHGTASGTTTAVAEHRHGTARKQPLPSSYFGVLGEIIDDASDGLFPATAVSTAYYLGNGRTALVVNMRGRASNFCFNKAQRNPVRFQRDATSLPPRVGQHKDDFHTTSLSYALIMRTGIQFRCRSDSVCCKGWKGTPRRPLSTHQTTMLFPSTSPEFDVDSTRAGGVGTLSEFPNVTALRDITPHVTALHLRRISGAACIMNSLAPHNTYVPKVRLWNTTKLLTHYNLLYAETAPSGAGAIGSLRALSAEEREQNTACVGSATTRTDEARRDGNFPRRRKGHYLEIGMRCGAQYAAARSAARNTLPVDVQGSLACIDALLAAVTQGYSESAGSDTTSDDGRKRVRVRK